MEYWIPIKKTYQKEKMNKLILSLTFIFLFSFSSQSQELIDIEAPRSFQIVGKANIGTAWLTFPKAFLVNPEDIEEVWSVAPAQNNLAAAIGAQGVVRLGKHWVFLPELGVSYLSGEIQIDDIKNGRASRHLQSYTRLDVPLHFAVMSTDNFWFAFGPTVFFTVHDNKGFDQAVEDLTPATQVDSDIPVGYRISLIAAIELSENFYIDARFEMDQGRHFRYNTSTQTYEVRSAMQNISIGIGYRLWHQQE